MRIKKKNLIFEERLKKEMPIPNAVKKLYDIFTKNGFELYIVGGAVRDLLTNSKIKDYDLATDAKVDEVQKMMDDNGISTKPTGTRFTVQNAWLDNEWYEIATFREDSVGGDGRRPDSVTYSDINGDAKRRDLTINALYYDIKTREIIDLVGGVDDIKNRVVRTVGDPTDRFNEDRLRILRAIRFTARVGSNLDPAIDKSLKQNNSLDLLKEQAVMEEFKKGVTSAKSVRQYLSLIEKYGLYQWVLKGIDNINYNYVESNDFLVVMAALLRDNDYNTLGKKLNSLEYSGDEIKVIKFLVKVYQEGINENNFIKLKEDHTTLQKNLKLTDETYKEFISLMDLDMNLHYKFMNYDLGKINAEYIKNNFTMDNGEPYKQGIALGKKIDDVRRELFFKSL